MTLEDESKRRAELVNITKGMTANGDLIVGGMGSVSGLASAVATLARAQLAILDVLAGEEKPVEDTAQPRRGRQPGLGETFEESAAIQRITSAGAMLPLGTRQGTLDALAPFILRELRAAGLAGEERAAQRLRAVASTASGASGGVGAGGGGAALAASGNASGGGGGGASIWSGAGPAFTVGNEGPFPFETAMDRLVAAVGDSAAVTPGVREGLGSLPAGEHRTISGVVVRRVR